jgi:hypothetical protein
LTLSEPDVIKIHLSGGAVAQLEARLDGIEEVEGSNPFGSTKLHYGFPRLYPAERIQRHYYVGQTRNLEERIAYYQGNYSKALKNRVPWKLVGGTAE